jgi:hypothetical protein
MSGARGRADASQHADAYTEAFAEWDDDEWDATSADRL